MPMNMSTMQDDNSNLAEILRFQQSLMRLVSQGNVEEPKAKGPATEQAQQLEVWVRKVRPKAS